MQTLLLFAALAVLFAFAVPPAFRFLRGAVMALALIVLAVMPAMAQTVGDVVNEATPLLLQLLSLVVMAVLTWAADAVRRKSGVQIQAKYKTDLHDALMTAARLAAARQLTGQAAMALMLEYAQKSVPDALAALSPPQTVLQDLAESKLQQVISEGIGKLVR